MTFTLQQGAGIKIIYNYRFKLILILSKSNRQRSIWAHCIHKEHSRKIMTTPE